MLRRSAALLALLVLVTGFVAAQDKKEIPKKSNNKEVPATVTKVDAEKGVLTVTTEDGRVLNVPAEGTRFVGPLGGVSSAGIKDDRLAKGAAVTLVIDPAGKKVVEVRLPGRSAAAGAKIEATVTKVNVDKGVLSVTTKEGKKADVPVGEDTKFVGPRGGLSTQGIRDDRLKPGAEVTIVLDKGGNKVLEVRLPFREGDTKDRPKDKK